MVLQEILESVGYQFQQAMNGPEALEYLTNSETLPDLILLDCMMPEMSGHQFVSILRETVPTSILPVIMVSAKADEKNIVEGLRSGCNDFVRCVVRGMTGLMIRHRLGGKQLNSTCMQSQGRNELSSGVHVLCIDVHPTSNCLARVYALSSAWN